MPLITGPELTDSLKLCRGTVKWLRHGLPTERIDASMALMIARAGSYEGKPKPSGGVYFIRELRPSRWQKCWRTTEAASVQPYAVTGEYSFA